MKHLAPTLCWLLVAPALAQDPPAQPPSEPAPGARPNGGGQLPAELFFDGIVAAVGAEVILSSDIDLFILRDQRHYGPMLARIQARERQTGRPDPEAQQALILDVMAELAQQKLMVQGGRDQGYAPEMVEAVVERAWKKEIEERGGYAQTSRWLAEGGATPAQFRQQIEDYILSQSWLQSQTGEQPGPTGRREVDRYVRPGLMHSTYGVFQESENAAERALVGILPERVVLQELILDVNDWNGLESTLTLAASLREAGRSRGAFEDLVENYSARPENGGLTREQPVDAFVAFSRARHGNEELLTFVRSAAVDSVSQPLPGLDEGSRPRAVYLYRMDQRLEAESTPRPFVDLGVQRAIRDNLLRTLDRRRAQEQLAELERAYFLWPDDLRRFLLARGLVSRR